MAALAHTICALLAVCVLVPPLVPAHHAPLVPAHHARAMENGIKYDGPHTTSVKIGEFSHFDAKQHTRVRRQATPMNQTIDDHHDYYTSRFYPPGPQADDLWVDLSEELGVEVANESGISDRFRFYEVYPLPFDFPIYGHIITNIAVTTAGFLYTGTFYHPFVQLTQYIAPLQADFNPGLNDTSRILILSTSQRFTVQWDKVHSHEHVEAGPFSFQVSLFPSGEMHFVYRQIPLLVDEINDALHPVEVGLSDAFYFDELFPGGILRRSIVLYNRIRLTAANNLANSAYVVSPLPNCIVASSCSECSRTTANSNFTCGWCDELERCSDGVDRHRQEWLESGCTDSMLTQCDDSGLSTGDSGLQLSTGATVGIAVGGVVFLLLVSLILVVIAVLLYGYRHPDSGIGLKMIEHRPKAWSLNKEKSASYNIESGKAVLEEQ